MKLLIKAVDKFNKLVEGYIIFITPTPITMSLFKSTATPPKDGMKYPIIAMK